MTGPQPPYGPPHRESGVPSQPGQGPAGARPPSRPEPEGFGEAGWFGQDREGADGDVEETREEPRAGAFGAFGAEVGNDNDATVRTSASRPSPVGPPFTADVPPSAGEPEATQVISSALEPPLSSTRPSAPTAEPEPADPFSDATQVVSMTSPPPDYDDQDQDDRYGGPDSTQVVSPGSMSQPGYGPPAPGGPQTGPGGFPPQHGGYPPPPAAPGRGYGGPGGGQPGWSQAEQHRGQPGPYGPGSQGPQAPFGHQGPPPGYGGPPPGQQPWQGQPGQYGQPPGQPGQQRWAGPPQQQPWSGQQPGQQPGQQQWGGQPPPYGPPQQQWGSQPYGQAGYGGYGQSAIRTDQLADWPQRAIGGLIDFGGFILAFFVNFLGTLTGSGFLDLIAWVLWLAGLGFALYNAYQAGETGQSIGKRVAKVKLVKEQTGHVIGGGNAILRLLCHIVDSIPCGLGFLAPLVTPKKQTLADMIMGTVVIRSE